MWSLLVLFVWAAACGTYERNGVVWMTGKACGIGKYCVQKSVSSNFYVPGTLAAECAFDQRVSLDLKRGEIVIIRLRYPHLYVVAPNGTAIPVQSGDSVSESYYCVQRLFMDSLLSRFTPPPDT